MERPENTRHDNGYRGSRKRLLVLNAYIWFKKGRRYLPPIVRGLSGLLLIFLGFLGFLPILGFWMIPLGMGLLATDIPPFARWFRKKLQQYKRHHQHNSE